MIRNLLLLCSLVLVAFANALVTARVSAQDQVDFAHDVVPLLKKHCAKCHGNDQRKGDFSINTRESILAADVIEIGKHADSDLYARINSSSDDRMPPEGEPLSKQELTTIRNWIDQGFKWEHGFSFKINRFKAPLAPRNPGLPPVVGGRNNPVDRFADAYFLKQGIEFPADIDEQVFLRRVSLDLIGLLPTAEQRTAFLADKRIDKRDLLVEALLTNRRAYADHWITFWNDLLRNDYVGTGYIDGGRMQISGWLYQSLLDNKPYDEFVRELIGGSNKQAEGFIRGIKWRGRVNASQIREVQFSQNISQVFLGTNLKCASCHDSFINDWKLVDAYGLAAIIAEKPLEIHRCDKPTGEYATVKFLYPELGEIDSAQPPAVRLQQLAGLMTHPDNGRVPRVIVNRLWQRMMGRGIVEPVDVMDNPPWSADLLDYLAYDLAENHYDLQRTMRLIATSRIYQSVSTPSFHGDPERYQFRGPVARRLTAEQFVDSIWQLTGTAPEKAVAPIELDQQVVPSGREPIIPPAEFFVRASLVDSNETMRNLGRPNREQVVSVRPDQLTTLEALNISNGQELASLLSRGAKNLVAKHPKKSNTDWTHFVFNQLLSRNPSQEESALCLELMESEDEEGLADLIWMIIASPEFHLNH